MQELSFGPSLNYVASTVYFMLFNSVGQVYRDDTAAFENYNAANIGVYALPGAMISTGLFVADMPAVARDTYTVYAVLQDGANPADDDYYIGQGELQWDGSTAGIFTVAGDAMTLEAAERTTTAAVFLSQLLEGVHTVGDGLRIMLAALAGKSTGGGTFTNRFRDVADSKNRIDATVDANGNRSAISIDGT